MLAPVAVPGVAAPSASAQQQDTRPVGARVLDETPEHDGKPYRYGATGPDAFDCSGYVQHVFGQHERQPGDLIAMRNSAGRVTHVGVYGGHDNWWAASTGQGRVMVQNLYSSNDSVGRFS